MLVGTCGSCLWCLCVCVLFVSACVIEEAEAVKKITAVIDRSGWIRTEEGPR